MNPRKFIAPSARQALARVKAELGEDAVILRNRSVDGGVEILAIDERAWLAEDTNSEPQAASPAPAPAPVSAPKPAIAARVGSEPMSTVSFESFSRQRRATRADGVMSTADATAAPATADEVPRGPELLGASAQPPRTQTIAGLVQELRQMRSYIGEQFSTLAWVDGVRRTPTQARLLRVMLDAGFSPRLARSLVMRLPNDYGDDEALVWLHASLARNLRCDDWTRGLLADQGVFALVGPTGVGKTTTAAKIAAHCALRHGTQSVGLITVDGYRIGARDQLRDFGQMIGVPVHIARDAQGLNESLQLFARKRLVLIDTAGVGQRDDRVGEVLAALSATRVQRLLVVSAAAQKETIDEVVDAYRGAEGAGIVLSKTDEACRLGGALDTLIRQRLRIVGVADGQRVPEDWHEPDAATLVSQALEQRSAEGFGMDDVELTMTMQRIGVAGTARDVELQLEVADV